MGWGTDLCSIQVVSFLSLEVCNQVAKLLLQKGCLPCMEGSTENKDPINPPFYHVKS